MAEPLLANICCLKGSGEPMTEARWADSVPG